MGELSKELVAIKLIPSTILPPEIKEAYEQEQEPKSLSPIKRGKTLRKKPVENTFTRMPMINVNDENRDFIEDKLTKLNSKVADAINIKINKMREEKAMSNMKKLT